MAFQLIAELESHNTRNASGFMGQLLGKLEDMNCLRRHFSLENAASVITLAHTYNTAIHNMPSHETLFHNAPQCVK